MASDTLQKLQLRLEKLNADMKDLRKKKKTSLISIKRKILAGRIYELKRVRNTFNLKCVKCRDGSAMYCPNCTGEMIKRAEEKGSR